MDTVGDWVRLVHGHWPPGDAADWDQVGLHVGDPADPVARVLVALDVTPEVVAEAARVEHTLVVAHHPLLFRPLGRLTPSTASGRTALAAARAGVAVLAAHTNLDVARDGTGTSDPVARVLDLRDVVPLSTDLRTSGRLKLVVFVPRNRTGDVLDALAAAGAATRGDYERVAYLGDGTGTFRPLEGANPAVGSVGDVEQVAEHRLEVEVPRSRVGHAVAAMLAAHPYEEVAYDLLPLRDGAEAGLGVVGDLPAPTTLRDVAERLRDQLPSPHLRLGGDPDRVVARVAAVGGSGGSHVGAALAAGAEVLVTGDLTHHVALDARTQGLALVDAGHHGTEDAAMPALLDALVDDAVAAGLRAEVVRSGTSTDPWTPLDRG